MSRDISSKDLGYIDDAGLAYAEFAEREVLKALELAGGDARPVTRVGVVGGGTMGAGIAVAALDAGLDVTMIERDAAALTRARGLIEAVYNRLIGRGRSTQDAKSDIMRRWHGSTSYEQLGTADLVVEAVFEDLRVKQDVFRELDHVCKPGAVLASNTSYLDIDVIAGVTARPADVLGLHFFSPANIMRLVEIVVPPRVGVDALATASAFARRLGKTPVRAGICDGFIGNRILTACRAAADAVMEDGASPYQIDSALRRFGFAMGPYQVMDLAGGDIAWATRKRRAATADPRARYVQIADRLCERGWFGQKTGRGFYLYRDGSRHGTPDPEVEDIVAEERRRAMVTPRTFDDSEIVRRYLAAMINEGARIVQEGIALRPLDVDVVLLLGYGFPRERGGPMHYAETVGLSAVLADIQEFGRSDPLFWNPAQLIVDLVARGTGFGSLN